MAKITEETLKAKIDAGKIGEREMLKALAYERDNLEIITMPTLGTFSHELNAREAHARTQLDTLAADAAVNVLLLERMMAERGWDTTTYVCGECGKHRATPTCPMCEMPEEY